MFLDIIDWISVDILQFCYEKTYDQIFETGFLSLKSQLKK
jgi:hypothetical protein